MHQEHRLGTGESHLDKTVGNVVVVSYPERFFVDRSDNDHHSRVKKGQGKNQKRYQYGETGKGVAHIKKTDLRNSTCTQ